jgi:predicted ATP-grasp superfamily ATP-dependent carboligase
MVARTDAGTALTPSSKTERASAIIAADLDLLRPFVGTGVPTLMLFAPKHRHLRHSRIVRDWTAIPDPSVDPEAALKRLVDVAARFPEKPVLYYADDAMLRLVYEHRAPLAAHYRFLMPDAPTVAACQDKLLFDALAARAEIPVPRTALGRDVAGAADVAEFGFPLVLKPSTHVKWFQSDAVALAGGRSRKVLVAEDKAEFERLLAATRRFTDRFVVQEFIPGGEDNVYSFHAYADENSAILASFVGRKIRTNPMVGGESACITLVRDFAVLRLGREIVRRLALKGPLKIDVKRDPRTGRDFVLEINLRYNLWHQLGAACGVNLPLAAYRHLTGLPAERRGDYRTDVRWLDLYGDLKAFWSDYRPSGAYTIGSYLRSLRGPKVFHLFAPSDPLPLLLSGWSLLAARARRIRDRPARTD